MDSSQTNVFYFEVNFNLKNVLYSLIIFTGWLVAFFKCLLKERDLLENLRYQKDLGIERNV